MILDKPRRVQLLKHPKSAASPAREIEVEFARRASALALCYAVVGDVKQICLPGNLTPARADGLWQHTCFEAFVRAPGLPAYREFNFSTSRQWAAYRFEAYRQGAAQEASVADPRIEIELDESMIRLSASLDLSGIAALVAHDFWQLGLSAIIQDRTGGISHWALVHPGAKPDFHDPGSFVLCLPS